ncbi:plasmid recombination protein [Vibrio parahaemolyticus]|uniref:MobV family relaxase n=1 Tax=Vibrio parahaemolyticus TaxID=670 RepID=UPI00299E7DFC|nr:MobV family relaxase [Vibrio parahaemolyticus]MDX1256812.1 plasmid recombination protein [Vibrio parahaemolyticus]
MTTTILRFEKHKHFVNIRQAGAHQHRHHKVTKNSDNLRKHLNKIFIGSSNLVSDVKTRLDTLTKQPRKNSVLAMDGILTLSPEVFIDGTKEEQYRVLRTFALASKAWLVNTFGDNVVNAVLHRDETSPHVHFTVVPIQENDLGQSKLNARDLFNKKTLHGFQRDYFDYMYKYFPNLQSPKYHDKATHTTLKEFYTGINELKVNMKGYFDSEFKKQRENLQEELVDSIRKNIDKWLEEIFTDVGEPEKETWIEEIKEALEWKLESSIDFNSAYKKINYHKKQI